MVDAFTDYHIHQQLRQSNLELRQSNLELHQDVLELRKSNLELRKSNLELRQEILEQTTIRLPAELKEKLQQVAAE